MRQPRPLFHRDRHARPLSRAARAPSRAHAFGWLVPTNTEIPPLAIRSHHVSVSVRERIAETSVTQTFLNSDVVDARSDLRVPGARGRDGERLRDVGERPAREGELLDSRTARSVYESIVARCGIRGSWSTSATTSFARACTRSRLAPSQRIEIRFTQTLEYQGSVVRYHYPLRAGAAYGSTLESLTSRQTSRRALRSRRCTRRAIRSRSFATETTTRSQR